MDRLSLDQCRRNRESDAAWALYAPHRERVTRILSATLAGPAQRLCVLGPGNLNDIDLAVLLPSLRDVLLVDVDAEAVRRGLERQGFDADARFRIVAPVDVTGALTRLADIVPDRPADDASIGGCLQALAGPPGLGLNASCDVVASVGLLTQLIDGVVQTVGDGHPRFWEIVSALRRQHIRLLLDLVRPGGTAMLITEVVSSLTCPALLHVREPELPGVLQEEIARKNFFTGTNPAAVQHLLATEPDLASQLSGVALISPWVWPFGDRSYAVYGVAMRKPA
jgi:hypothetical protein